MNFLLDINHPAQVHLLRNLYFTLTAKGHKVIVTVKEQKSTQELLKLYSIPFKSLGSKDDSILGKTFMQLLYNARMLFWVLRHRISVGVGSSITVDHVSRVSPMFSIHLSDDDPEVVPFVYKYSYPFSDIILSPDVLNFGKYSYKNIGYPGYHELAYLHPQRFSPDPSVLKCLDLSENDTFFVMRFNAFKAHHDNGKIGLNSSQKIEVLKVLESKGRVFITTEREIEPELDKYKLVLSPEKIHSLLYYASLFVGDSQTMTTEAAILGTPALKCNSFAGELSVHNELENVYNLCYSFKTNQFDDLLKKMTELLSTPNLKEEWHKRRSRLLNEKIDLSSLLEYVCIQYPQSISRLKGSPQEIYEKFRNDKMQI